MTPVEEIEAALSDLVAEVHRLIEQAESGHPVDVIGLNLGLPDLCAGARAVPVEHREDILSKLTRLESDLERLARAIESQLRNSAAQTSSDLSPGQAAAAYKAPKGS